LSDEHGRARQRENLLGGAPEIQRRAAPLAATPDHGKVCRDFARNVDDAFGGSPLLEPYVD
jgi:hypothetical protein